MSEVQTEVILPISAAIFVIAFVGAVLEAFKRIDKTNVRISIIARNVKLALRSKLSLDDVKEMATKLPKKIVVPGPLEIKTVTKRRKGGR